MAALTPGIYACPAHDDRAPSLSVSRGAGGRLLLHCHAGCDTGAILRAWGLRWGDLFPDDSPSVARRPRSLPERARDAVYARGRRAEDRMAAEGEALILSDELRRRRQLVDAVRRCVREIHETAGTLGDRHWAALELAAAIERQVNDWEAALDG